MAKSREYNPITFVALMLAASALATTIYLNHSHRPASLHLADSDNAPLTAYGDTAPRQVAVRGR
ncbi:hypothetical protein [Hyphobacterium sp.]|uniref:hypothetical protein n=1 Tax=Hyphobacterium sp. TaxID=2004662 RepID=UPI003B52F2C0